MSDSRKSKRQQLFSPDEIATKVHQAITRDIERSLQEYDQVERYKEILGRNLVRDLLKKYTREVTDKDRLVSECYEGFIADNDRMAEANAALRAELPQPSSRVQRRGSFRDNVHLRARALVHFVLTAFTEDEWFQECKHGSGTSVGVPFSDTSLERKFLFPISCTSSVKPLMQRYLDFNRGLKEAVFSYNSENPVNSGWYQIVKGARATTVDKTTDKRRFISIEPTGNMFFQQGLMLMMYKRMALVGLNTALLPDEHKWRAYRASITCREATIDWSSASNSVSIELVKWCLPAAWFAAVMQTRSKYTALHGEDVELHMIATMGNAVTFPLETLIFWAYGHAVRLSLEDTNALFPEWEHLKVISVFGDDCIVPTDMAEPYMGFLTSLGFLVNIEKSYYQDEGFRESCGGDYLHGIDVRPFHLRAPGSRKISRLEPWLYVIWNSLLKKYISYFGDLDYVYDRALFNLLVELCLRYKLQLKLVPDDFPDDAGLKVSNDFARFRRCYPDLVWSKVAVSKHGTYRFRYCRFVYQTRLFRNDGIRYQEWLRKPVLEGTSIRSKGGPKYMVKAREDLGIDPFSVSFAKMYDRKVGGYVVAYGFSSHWSFDSD